MLFNSLQYLVFFPIVVALYFITPRNRRWMLLLAASYYFYMCWKVEYVLLIVASTLVDYFAGMRMGAEPDKPSRRKYLILSIFTNLGLLFAFKYFNFANESLRYVFDQFNIFYGIPHFDVLLPVGISFYTFQTLSYSISVYRGVHPPERHLGIFALYVSFFPQLVAGPIERSHNLLPQFYQNHEFEYRRVTDGLKLIMWGLFKKVVIADRVAAVANTVFNSPHEHTGPQLLVGTIFFAFQIYCDFSGYSDIAIGSAQVMGFRLMKNFDRPYYAKSISEFWQRWHISLSTWFRDYLYISLGGNRVGKTRWYFNLFITFLISGMWHGANWTFLIWGGLNGLYLIIETFIDRPRRAVMRMLKLGPTSWGYKIPAVAVTFALTCFAWIFFRANTVADAFYIAGHVTDGLGGFLRSIATLDMPALNVELRGLGLSQRELVIAVLSIAFMEGVHFLQRNHNMRSMLSNRPVWLRWAVYYALIAGIVLLGAFNQSQQFIYFQF